MPTMNPTNSTDSALPYRSGRPGPITRQCHYRPSCQPPLSRAYGPPAMQQPSQRSSTWLDRAAFAYWAGELAQRGFGRGANLTAGGVGSRVLALRDRDSRLRRLGQEVVHEGGACHKHELGIIEAQIRLSHETVTNAVRITCVPVKLLKSFLEIGV